MRKRFMLLLVFVMILFSKVIAQVYTGDITLTNQAQVDAFNYTSITGRLTITSSSGAITNLDGLSELTEVTGFLVIINNSSLANLDGLSNLEEIKSLFGHLKIENNDALANVDGLLSLTKTPGLIIKGNAALTNVDGLSNLDDMVFGGLIIEDNPLLTDIDGLSKLHGSLHSDIKIINNQSLTNIDGLSDLTSIGHADGPHSVEISNNRVLTNIDGLSSLEEVIDGNLVISFNAALTNIDGLSKLKLVGQTITIKGNAVLPNVDGLSSLEAAAVVGIEFNTILTNLNGLSALNFVPYDLVIRFNGMLVDFCGLYNLFNDGEIGREIIITSNGANTIKILAPAPITVNADPGLCSAVVSVPDPGIDGCLVPITLTKVGVPTGDVYPVGITNITWKASDGAGNTATAIQIVTVVDNQPPSITCPGNISVKCASDVPAADINSVTASDNCLAIVTHEGDVISNQTCANRFTLTRTYTATDPAGNTARCSQVITVNDDVPPQLTGLGVSKEVLWPPNHKMQDISLNYTATDNCVSSPIVTIAVSSNEPVDDTGDGDTAPDWEIIDNHHLKLRAERAANGSGRIYTITVTVDDGCNTPVSQSKEVIVAHNITAPQSGKPFKVGSIVSFSGEFWDKPGNTHFAKWLLDGSTSVKGTVTEPSLNKNGKATGSYKFNTAGVFKLQMNITDQTGLTSYANTNEDVDAIVVIYDPNGGNTYGGGYFNSPAGALRSNPTATGKASYGFAMNYFKNSTYPKGETQFEFKVGEFEFNALNFDYLVISNSMAQFKGTGKIIGGQSGVGFTMTVVDGQLDGSGIDKIRMKIYNKNNGAIIYDNQPGASDASIPTQVVGTNSSIVVSGSNSNLTQSNTGIQKAEMESAAPANKLDVIAYPNPTQSDFRITIQGNSTEQVTMQVVDMYGRVIETRNINAHSIIRFGDRYRPGTYFVRIMQGKEQKQLKLIKLFD